MLETLADEQETREPVMVVCEKCGQENQKALLFWTEFSIHKHIPWLI